MILKRRLHKLIGRKYLYLCGDLTFRISIFLVTFKYREIHPIERSMGYHLEYFSLRPASNVKKSILKKPSLIGKLYSLSYIYIYIVILDKLFISSINKAQLT